MSRDLISVIIPVYNRAELIKLSIDSVLGQTFPHFELLVIDDFSSDHTADVVENYDDLRIRCIRHKKNKGAAVARNTGISEAKGQFIAFLDSDDEWLPEKLAIQMNQFAQLEDQNTILFSPIIRDVGEKKYVFPRKVRYSSGDISEYLFNDNGLIQTDLIFGKADVIKMIGFKDNLKRHQDYDFVLRAAKMGIRFKEYPKPLAIWHCGTMHERMGTNRDFQYSYEWVKENRELFTKKSFEGFFKRDIYAQLNRYSIRSYIFLFKLLIKGEISFHTFNNMLFRKIFEIPITVLVKIRNRLTN